MTLGELSERLGGELVTAPGESDKAAGNIIHGVAGIETAGQGEVTFVANPKYASRANRSAAGAVIVEPAFPPLSAPTIRHPNPKLAFSQAVELFHPPTLYTPGVHTTACIHPTAQMGLRVHVGPFAVVGERCRIGDDAVILAHAVLYPDVVAGDHLLLHAHAVIREGSRLGKNVVIGNGSVVGGDGFGFARNSSGQWIKTIHPGPVLIEDDVEIQANACIDRSVVGQTRIGRGVKIDNLVQVGHASTVGEDTLLCAQVGLAGSTYVGKGVILAGQVGVAGHLTVGDGVVATAQTGIPSDVPAGTIVSGYPAMENRTWLRMVASLQRVPELLHRMRKLEKE